jgi:hypothetical protein
MRRCSAPTGLPPAALLALAVVVCGGSVANAATTAALLQQSHDRATQITRDRDVMASLLASLGEVVKKHHAVAASPRQVTPLACAPCARPVEAAAQPHRRPLPPRLIDLPPPSASL